MSVVATTSKGRFVSRSHSIGNASRRIWRGLVVLSVLAVTCAMAPSTALAADPGTPSAPQNVVTYEYNGRVDVDWDDATSAGGEIINYLVVSYRKNALGEKWIDRQPPWLDTWWYVFPLDNGTEYQFRVKARNQYGYEPWSATVTGTPKTTPSAPFTLSAESAGASSIKVNWSKPQSGYGPTGYRVELTVNDWEDAVSATMSETGDNISLTVTGLLSGTPYKIRVRAHNNSGFGPWKSGATATTDGNRVPTKPIITVSTCDDSEATVTITTALDPGSLTLTAIEYQYKTHSQSWSNDTIISPPGNSQSYTFEDLNNGVFYSFRARGVSSAGNGKWADAQDQTASPSGMPTDVRNLRLVPGDGAVTATWSQPANNGGHDIVEYAPWWVDVSGGTPNFNFTNIRLDASTFTWTKSSLTNGEQYSIAIQPYNACDKASELQSPSQWVVAGSPVASGAPMLTTGDSQITASWTAPGDNGSAITHYDLQHRKDGVGNWTPVEVTNGTSHTMMSLSSGTYEVQVRAVNGRGDGPWSASATATVVGVPDAPAAPSLTAGDGQITAVWTAPGHNGSAITHYDLQYRESPSGTWQPIDDIPPTSTSRTISQLDNGTTYEVQVRAANGVGDGDWSSSATATPQLEAPGVPGSLALTEGDEEITASWNAPTSGGTPSHYDLQYRQDGVGNCTPVEVTSGTSHVITSLTNGTTYEVQVRAANSTGDSNWSDSSTGTPYGVPAAPAAPMLTAGDTQITASWDAPSNNGSDITEYTLAWVESGESDWDDELVEEGTSYTIMSLTNGTEYDVRVLATNARGNSAWSPTETATPEPALEAPGTPDKPELEAGDEQITASWEAPSSGGAPSHYDVQYREDGIGSWTEEEVLSGTELVIDSLTNGTTYEVQVRAANSTGDSIWSASSTEVQPPHHERPTCRGRSRTRRPRSPSVARRLARLTSKPDLLCVVTRLVTSPATGTQHTFC